MKTLTKVGFVFICFLISIIIVFRINKDGFVTDSTIPLRISAFIINMDKNKERWNRVIQHYNNSDMTELKLQRYSAVVGKDVNVYDWLSPYAIVELEQVERNKFRLYHYQLTMGGIGCFLSHYNLMKKLIDDPDNDYYFIMEDDIVFSPTTYLNIKQSIINAPPNWNMLLYGYIRTVNDTTYNDNNYFIKLNAFWGMQGYLVNKKGAKIFVEEADANKIDGQVDAFLSRMIQQGKIDIYAYKKRQIATFDSISDIQNQLLIQPNINPFMFKGYSV